MNKGITSVLTLTNSSKQAEFGYVHSSNIYTTEKDSNYDD